MAVDWNSPRIIEAVRRGALRGVGIGIALVESRAVYLITQTGKTGRIYRRRGVKHQSSAPGEPFANDSGDTLKRRSIKVDAGQLRGTLSFHSENARRMELGTRKMKPRPFARRALIETQKEVQDVIFAEVMSELRKL